MSQTIWIGKFWIAGSPGTTAVGQADLSGHRPEITIFGALTPAFTTTQGAPGVIHYHRAANVDPVTIHGELLGAPSRITVFGAISMDRASSGFLGFVPPGKSQIESQRFEGDIAVLGSHLADLEVPFPAVRYRVNRQDIWAWRSGLSMPMTGKPGAHNLRYRRTASLASPLISEAGSLALDEFTTVSPLRLAGAYILTRTIFHAQVDAGITLNEAWARFVNPTATLMTLLNNTACEPVLFEVFDSVRNDWSEVRLPGLVPDISNVFETKEPVPPLLWRKSMSLHRIVRWLDVARDLSPLTQILAAAVGSDDWTVENRLLGLATAAEGIHRRLYPNAHRLTKAQETAAKAALKDSGVAPKARDILLAALDYLGEPSYPMRLQHLATSVATYLPSVTGKTNRWKSAVVSARNGFAHQLDGKPTTTKQLVEFHVLTESLRWLLTARLLGETGLTSAKLRGAFDEYAPYQRFLNMARRDYSRIF